MRLCIKRTLEAGLAYRQGYVADLNSISHRWEHPKAPDGTGAQLAEIRAYVDAHPEVVGVWYDYCCMPQGESKTPAQKVRFKHMLGNVNLLYLGCQVLALIDISYLSRFWTQFEAWLSMQEGSSAAGLRAAPEARRRVQRRVGVLGVGVVSCVYVSRESRCTNCAAPLELQRSLLSDRRICSCGVPGPDVR